MELVFEVAFHIAIWAHVFLFLHAAEGLPCKVQT